MNSGIVLENLSPAELARQALVLYVDGGVPAGDFMDSMEESYLQGLRDEENESAWLAATSGVGGIVDNMSMPEGMNLREGFMGVIQPNA